MVAARATRAEPNNAATAKRAMKIVRDARECISNPLPVTLARPAEKAIRDRPRRIRMVTSTGDEYARILTRPSNRALIVGQAVRAALAGPPKLLTSGSTCRPARRAGRWQRCRSLRPRGSHLENSQTGAAPSGRSNRDRPGVRPGLTGSIGFTLHSDQAGDLTSRADFPDVSLVPDSGS